MRKVTITLFMLFALLLSFIGKSPVTASTEESTTKKLAASADRIYVLARESRMVRILDASRKELKRFEIVTPYSRAQSDPVDIAFAEETLYVLDAEFSEIWCYTPDGVYTHNLPLVTQYLASPSALCVKGNRLWIADSGCIWVTDEKGNVISRITLPSGDNGIPAVISDMTLSESFLYVVDALSARIFSVSINGDAINSQTFFGVESGRFQQASGITYFGNLYVTDSLRGTVSVVNSHTRESRFLSIPDPIPLHPTDIQFWKKQFWMVDRDSDELKHFDYSYLSEKSTITLSVNVMDFGSLSVDYQAPFSCYSVFGTPVSGTIVSDHPAFQVSISQWTEETVVTPYVKVIASKLKPGIRETGNIRIRLDNGIEQRLEVRAKKKEDKDFLIWYGSHAILSSRDNKIKFNLVKQNGIQGNLEFSVGKTFIPFTVAWELPKMPFVNDRMENTLVVKPIGKPESNVYFIPILVKVPEEKLVKQMTITFLYKSRDETVPGTILGEYFAAEWCEYCPAGHMALPELHQKYTKDEIVFVTYYNDCVKEAPERLCFPEGDARMKWYAPVGLHVALILNGTTIKEGGYNDGVTTMTKEYDELIKGLSPMTSPVSLSGSANWDETNRKLSVGATLECLQDIPWKTPRLYCILAEHGIKYDAQNGVKVHDYVMRDFLSLPNPENNDAFGSPVWGLDGEILSKADDQWQGHLETTVDPLVKMENAFCILFVQDNETKQVYQARYIPLHENKISSMQWVPERKTVRLAIDQTARVKTWLVNRGNLMDTFSIDIFNHKPFFGEDSWFVGGNEYAINQEVSVTLNPMESVLVEVPISPVWGKPEMPALELKATDSTGKELYCQIPIQGTELQPRFEVLYPDSSILDKEKGYTLDRNHFSCVIRTEPGTYLESNKEIKASADGILLVSLSGCYQPYQYGISLVYPDQQTQSVLFYYTFTLEMKLTIGSRTVWINREHEEIEAAPFIKNSRTMVPIRIVVENLLCAAKIDWDAQTHDITITYKDGVIVIPEGKDYVVVNENKVKLDAPPENVNGRVFLPIRFFAETLGAKVEWDAKTQTVTIKN
ncbi:hypothetical protein LLG10_06440 [bacterium]|nr:hypothetical protein [bacterium]